MLQAEAAHRGHAIVEQVIADLARAPFRKCILRAKVKPPCLMAGRSLLRGAGLGLGPRKGDGEDQSAAVVWFGVDGAAMGSGDRFDYRQSEAGAGRFA